MIKSKKQISIIAGLCSILLIGSISSIILVATYHDSNKHHENNNPLNRDKSFQHFEIQKYLENSHLNDCLELKTNNNHYYYEINNSKYLDLLHSEIQTALKKINQFKTKYKQYRLELSYQIDQKNLLVKNDLVWYLKDNLDEKFYDQFEIKFAK